MDNVFTDFVEKIANENPIEPIDYVNVCRFCGRTWAEDTYDEYLGNVELLKVDPGASHDRIHKIAWEHHHPDCLWVEANELLRR